jgi:hypothetical protein
MPAIEHFDEDFRGHFDFEDEDVAPTLRLTESVSCIECYPSPCSCGIAQSAFASKTASNVVTQKEAA